MDKYSIYVISAILGNWWQESQLNPMAGSLTGFYGLGQWGGGRRSELLSYLDSEGLSYGDGNGQVLFLFVENFWQINSLYSAFQNLDSFLESKITDIGYLVRAFMHSWEIVDDGTEAKRIEYANRIKDYITEHYDDESITEWVVRSGWLTESETLNNAVMAWRMMNGKTPTKMDIYILSGIARELYRRILIKR